MSLDCGPRCETDWQLGVAGVCNTTTGICVCPEGYDGIDDWEVFNDCHVDATLRRKMRLAIIGLSCLQILVGVISLIYLSSKSGSWLGYLLERLTSYEFTEEASKARFKKAKEEYELSATYKTQNLEAIKANDESFSEMESELDRENLKQMEFAKLKGGSKDAKDEKSRAPAPVNVLSNQQRSGTRPFYNTELQLKRTTNRRAAILVILIILFGIANLYYQLAFLYVNKIESRVENNPGQDLALAYGVGNILAGIWYVIYIWYKSLPDLQVYGRLFGFRGFVIKRQLNIARLILLLSYSAFLSQIVLLFILPTKNPENLKKYNFYALWSFAGLSFGSVLFLTVVLGALLRVYQSSLEALELRKKALENEANTTKEGDDIEEDRQKPFKIEVSFGDNSASIEERLAAISIKESEILTARTNQHRQIAGSWIVICMTVAVILGILYIPEMQTNYYLSFSTLTMLAILVANAMVINVVFISFK